MTTLGGLGHTSNSVYAEYWVLIMIEMLYYKGREMKTADCLKYFDSHLNDRIEVEKTVSVYGFQLEVARSFLDSSLLTDLGRDSPDHALPCNQKADLSHMLDLTGMGALALLFVARYVEEAVWQPR